MREEGMQVRTLTDASGKRVTVSETAALHRKIDEMGQRIRQLEDALSLLQASVSSEQHPLLRDEYMRIKFPLSPFEDTKLEKEGVPAGTVDLADAVGTLTLDEGGHARYLGRTAGPESLLGGEHLHSAELESTYSSISPEIAQLSRVFPFGEGSRNTSHSLNLIILHLPDRTRARSLCETYFTQALWSNRIVMRDELIDEILTSVYTHIESLASSSREGLLHARLEDEPIPTSPHRLAVLFFTLAIGTLVDSSESPYSNEAQKLFDLGKACLSLDNVLESSELATIQALVLIGVYYNHGGPWYSPETPWTSLGLCTKLALRVARTTYVPPVSQPAITANLKKPLDSESPKWNLDPKTINRRRVIFWELFFIDTFAGLSLGRPPGFSVPFIVCPFPEKSEDGAESDDMKVLRWGWKFSRDVAAPIVTATLTPKIPDYAIILDLDKKIREHGLPPIVGVDDPLYMQTRGIRLSATTSMYIHRSFFVKAILDYPHDPLRSPYASSFLAAYNSASTVIQLDVSAFSRDPSWLSRRWGVFNSLMSAGVILGSIVTRCPTDGMAHKAYADLTSTVDMFSRISDSSSRANAAHNILKELHDKATRILNQARGREVVDRGSNETHDSRGASDNDLEIFAGYTKVRMSKSRGKQSHRGDSFPTSASPQPEIGHRAELGRSFGHAPGIAFSSSSRPELSAAYISDPFASSSSTTTGPKASEVSTGSGSQEHQSYLQMPSMHGHAAYDYCEIEHRTPPRSGLEDAPHMVDWEGQPPQGNEFPSTLEVMAGGSGINAPWLTFMQEEGFMDPYGNLNPNAHMPNQSY
ncbi:hypothetical protein AAF712_000135 [Marasmius tenuissimus]|uniref:Xylanolytic transcriptional activator regulatory domain-containing protein n=1 Tax=Marasmius tenuissimus TaxID=585030 RepID=A0ABR3AIH0_9AGAR